MDKKSLLVVIYNHMDPMHRRCFDRAYEFKGKTFVSYADLEERYILENLKYARKYPDYKFVIETALVARKFLERNPEAAAELRALADAGRMCVSGCGDNIIDSNMVLGENLVRNFVTGLLWVEDTFGQTARMANRLDAFGNSAQLPQILRGCGLKWCWGATYTPPDGTYWKGLDGSIVLVRGLPQVGEGGHYRVYAPCPACDGKKETGGRKCAYCDGLGVDRVEGDSDWRPAEIDDEAFGDFTCGLVRVGGEELLPNPQTIPWMESLRERYNARFALLEEAMPYVERLLERVDDPDDKDLCSSVELNPNNTGCYVTRIKTKQTCRRQEYALLSAEALCLMAARRGLEYPAGPILKIWQKLFFTMFHDAITGTHVDPSHEELKDIWAEIDARTAEIKSKALRSLVKPAGDTISVINATGNEMTGIAEVGAEGGAASFALEAADGSRVKLLDISEEGGHVKAKVLVEGLKPFSAAVFCISGGGGNHTGMRELEEPMIENGRYRITADCHGLLAVYDKLLGMDILKDGAYRPGEFILEHDEGSPWATLSPDMERTPLSQYTRLVEKAEGPGFQRLSFEIPVMHSFAEDAVGIRYSVTLWDGLDRIDFRAKVLWEDYSHRLRVAMPVPFSGRHVYEIPYGQLAREQYEPKFATRKHFHRWSDPTGDWPAVNWAGVEGPKACVALMNKGTPSYRIERGKDGADTMLLSVLRSPCVPTYLHEPRAYTMTDWDGMRDGGMHEFEYAVASYAGSLADSSIVADAEGYNAGFVVCPGRAELPDMPRLRSGNVRIACVKMAEKGGAMVLRLAEYRGMPGEAEVELPEYVLAAAKVNLLERQAEPLDIKAGRVRLRLRAFEIATLRLDMR